VNRLEDVGRCEVHVCTDLAEATERLEVEHIGRIDDQTPNDRVVLSAKQCRGLFTTDRQITNQWYDWAAAALDVEFVKPAVTIVVYSV